MELRLLILIFFDVLLIKSESNFSGIINEIKTKYYGHKVAINQYDSYMVLYFKEDCNYSKGFKNNYRKNISFIINRENDYNLTSEETLIIHKGFGIEIHFNSSIRDLGYFFHRYSDNNLVYLESIDSNNFDLSLVTNMEKMFHGCLSLKSISWPNIIYYGLYFL